MSMKKKSEFDRTAGRGAVRARKGRASNRCRRPGTSEKIRLRCVMERSAWVWKCRRGEVTRNDAWRIRHRMVN